MSGWQVAPMDDAYGSGGPAYEMPVAEAGFGHPGGVRTRQWQERLERGSTEKKWMRRLNHNGSDYCGCWACRYLCREHEAGLPTPQRKLFDEDEGKSAMEIKQLSELYSRCLHRLFWFEVNNNEQLGVNPEAWRDASGFLLPREFSTVKAWRSYEGRMEWMLKYSALRSQLLWCLRGLDPINGDGLRGPRPDDIEGVDEGAAVRSWSGQHQNHVWPPPNQVLVELGCRLREDEDFNVIEINELWYNLLKFMLLNRHEMPQMLRSEVSEEGLFNTGSYMWTEPREIARQTSGNLVDDYTQVVEKLCARADPTRRGEHPPQEHEFMAHFEFLCPLLNFGGALRLAIRAKMVDIARDVLQLYGLFEKLTKAMHQYFFHSVPNAEAVLQYQLDDALAACIQNGEPNPFECMNCNDRSHPDRSRMMASSPVCMGCTGPRVTKNPDDGRDIDTRDVAELERCGAALDRNRENCGLEDSTLRRLAKAAMRKKWATPFHPVHSRDPCGKNAILCLMESGDSDGGSEMREMLLPYFPDVLATTFRGDTGLHLAARLDRSELIDPFISEVLNRREISVPELYFPPRDDYLHYERVEPPIKKCFAYSPLEDMQEVLIEAESRSRTDYVQGTKANQPNCPCKASKPQNLYVAQDVPDETEENGWEYFTSWERFTDCHGTTASGDDGAFPLKSTIEIHREDWLESLDRGDADASLVASFREISHLRKFKHNDDGKLTDWDGNVLEMSPPHGNAEETRWDGKPKPSDEFARRTSLCKSFEVFRDMRNGLGRTALHTAAVMDRDLTASKMLALGSDPAARDKHFTSALQEMVQNIPASALLSLNQFYNIDKSTRTQQFFLADLECLHGSTSSSNSNQRIMITPALKVADPSKEGSVITSNMPSTLLSDIVSHNAELIVNHPVIHQMIKMKWDSYASMQSATEMTMYFLYLIAWTIVAWSSYAHERDHYHVETPAGRFRIAIEIFASLWTLWKLYGEFIERHRDRTIDVHKKYQLERRVHGPLIGERDHLLYSPAEYAHRLRNWQTLNEAPSTYAKDWSNSVSIMAYICLVLGTLLGLIGFFVREGSDKEAPDQDKVSFGAVDIGWGWFSGLFLALGLIFAWIQAMKFFEPYTQFGYLVAVLFRPDGMLRYTTVVFMIFFAIVYIPVCAIFSMFFGIGVSQDMATSTSWFAPFQMMLIDYDFDSLNETDGVMSYLFYVFWNLLAAIVLLNLFIAMMGDTFQAIKDQAQTQAHMQKAAIVLKYEVIANNPISSFAPSKIMAGKLPILSDLYNYDTAQGRQGVKQWAQEFPQVVNCGITKLHFVEIPDESLVVQFPFFEAIWDDEDNGTEDEGTSSRLRLLNAVKSFQADTADKFGENQAAMNASMIALQGNLQGKLSNLETRQADRISILETRVLHQSSLEQRLAESLEQTRRLEQILLRSLNRDRPGSRDGDRPASQSTA